MATYPVKNLKTGRDQRTLHDHERIHVVEENPDWDKDWSKGCAGLVKLVTGVIKCPRHILVGRM